ncbi:MAG: hypothetical protein QNK89_10060 [Lacinutrix sp.]|uniref:hypothetical protein n=1 Tax=Lacinutrix sp. TaxID=1937692 RepID=UPI00309878BE
MKKYFSQNKEVLNLISNKASQGNKDAVDFIEILTQSYDQAIAKHTKNNIDLLIFAYYGSKKTLDKFKELEQAFDAEIDSLEMHKAYYDKETQKEIDEYKIKIDSLKKE